MGFSIMRRIISILSVVLVLVFSPLIQGCGSDNKAKGNGNMTTVEIQPYAIPAPVYIGEIGTNFKTGKLTFANATQDNGSSAVFGEGEDALYVYSTISKDLIAYVGGKDTKNTIEIESPLAVKIYKTSVDEDMPIYILNSAYDLDCDYTIIGRKLDGTFVKLIDTKEITKQYFPNKGKSDFIIYDSTIQTKDDEIVVDCFTYNAKSGKKFPGTKLCQFHFKWNEIEQSFDVEQIQAQQEKAISSPAPQQSQSNEVPIGTYDSGLNAYIMANTLDMISYRVFSVTVKAVDDNGMVVYVDYSFDGAPGRPTTWKNSQGYSGTLDTSIQSVETNIYNYVGKEWGKKIGVGQKGGTQ